MVNMVVMVIIVNKDIMVVMDIMVAYMQKTCDVEEMAILAKKNCGKSA